MVSVVLYLIHPVLIMSSIVRFNQDPQERSVVTDVLFDSGPRRSEFVLPLEQSGEEL